MLWGYHKDTVENGNDDAAKDESKKEERQELNGNSWGIPYKGFVLLLTNPHSGHPFPLLVVFYCRVGRVGEGQSTDCPSLNASDSRERRAIGCAPCHGPLGEVKAWLRV
ncbi:hypothetical protein NW767_010881 [Fusarium falciforme]|uniref:Uncharacterized protein n=1 Tax=Fusarium falciforme TaxID=195108 RepID=A0A9W8V652_9HYPO|nr:hypothetical protein NW767_010881 [Fusarium falciforme]KAJ4198320.1 hypothetical protein NW755_001007 [Fusarium falciforme]KAJ4261836.1 hypothetical protein NW757_000107 [Fusarium falciforme]